MTDRVAGTCEAVCCISLSSGDVLGMLMSNASGSLYVRCTLDREHDEEHATVITDNAVVTWHQSANVDTDHLSMLFGKVI